MPSVCIIAVRLNREDVVGTLAFGIFDIFRGPPNFAPIVMVGARHALRVIPSPALLTNARFRDAAEGGIVGDFPSGRSQPHRLPHQAGRYQAISGAVERVTTRALPTAIIDDLRRIVSDRRKKKPRGRSVAARGRDKSRVSASHI